MDHPKSPSKRTYWSKSQVGSRAACPPPTIAGDCSRDSVNSDEEISSGKESVKGVLNERTENYSIPRQT
ncbi:hypothetical protein Bca52824_095123 [Brassica carinata]|uniref:Uncharacterized protein n=1 Tax=Brassica carinata TaxID=52824 RepID=A0A8X7P347_BRACI|nr:hypothetical protein Bca52824_095123 [Brassica carinata]